MEEASISLLGNLLKEIDENRNSHFTGASLVLYNQNENLPISPLRDDSPSWLTLPNDGNESISSIILRLNQIESLYHDGFHLISKDGILTHICQYFSPPIVPMIEPDFSKGGRFRAAQYGSCIQNVIATGVIGHTYGPYIFISGKTYLP